jgi:hypothetical protein
MRQGTVLNVFNTSVHEDLFITNFFKEKKQAYEITMHPFNFRARIHTISLGHVSRWLPTDAAR